MPAASSSPADPVFCHLFAAADGLDGDRATVLSVLAAVADRGRGVGCGIAWQ
jgi:hypothetical protein